MVDPNGPYVQQNQLNNVLPSTILHEEFECIDGDEKDASDTGCHKLALQKVDHRYDYDETKNLIIAFTPYSYDKETHVSSKYDIRFTDFDQDNISLGGMKRNDFYIHLRLYLENNRSC